MHKVIVKKARGEKFKVTCDHWGIPNKEIRARLQSYIGMLSRTIIPIDIVNWTSVDPEIKSKIWIDIQEIHEAQSERVSQRKYHHRLSRKGYIGLKEDEIKKESCIRKKNPIEQFFGKKLGSGKMAKRSNMSMKTWLLYAKKLDEKVDKKTQALEVEIAELKAMMASGITLHSPIMSEKASHQLEKAFVVACSDDDDDVDECVPTLAPLGVLGQRSGELYVNTIDYKVAFGHIPFMVYPGKDKEKVHGIDIPLGHKCVSVDGLLKPDALLSVPIKKKERNRPGKKPGLDLNNLKSDFLKGKPSAIVPKGFKLLYKHVVTWMKTTGVSIQIKCEKEVFGHEKVIYLLHENVQAVLEFEMLGQAILASYMMYLHSEMSERPELAEKFAFIDPGSTYYLNTEFETYIMNRLKEGNPDRLFFLPHNQKALKSFNSKTGRGNHKPSKAKFLSWLHKTHMCYTEEQLDEVRVEALEYIQEHIRTVSSATLVLDRSQRLPLNHLKFIGRVSKNFRFTSSAS
ncbi:hypothetical protein AgCh_034029 [Apium graveolens]